MSRPRFLASVADLAEARLVTGLGADLVDLKDPHAGALGAWSPSAIRGAVLELGPRVTLSATTGDLPTAPEPVVAAAEAVAATGVAYVKIGLFARTGAAETIAALAPLAGRGTQLVAVMMADADLGPDLLPALAAAGFKGAMLDTADKSRGHLLGHRSLRELALFVAQARALGLLSGLAGSLRLEDVAPLAALDPDILGFRSTLCRSADRRSVLDPGRVRLVGQAVRRARKAATATAGKALSISPEVTPRPSTRLEAGT